MNPRSLLTTAALLCAAPLAYLAFDAADPGPATDAAPAPLEAEAPPKSAGSGPEAGAADASPAFPEAPGDAAFQDDAVRPAVERALAYLARQQDPRTGGWRQDVGFKFNDQYEVTEAGQPHVGVSSLALMAFIAGGHLPGRGRYGDVVERGTDFVLSCVDEDTGYISAHGTRMYSHAFATLFLAEIYGMTRRADLHQKLQHAVDLTVSSQNREGAWRYRPHAPDSDMSIAVTQVMALRAARNIGISVPRSTINRAYTYIQNSSYPRHHPHAGNFKYMLDEEMQRVSFALTAAGIAALLHAGYYDDPMVRQGLEELKRRIRNPDYSERYPGYFYWYGHYYAAQVMFIASDRDPALWNDFYWPLMRRDLLSRQQSDGSWESKPGPGPVFGTAIAAIILQIPYQYLPIFQR